MKTNEVRLIDANALLDAMPKSDVLLRHQVVDVICNSPSIDIAPVITGEMSDGYTAIEDESGAAKKDKRLRGGRKNDRME